MENVGLVLDGSLTQRATRVTPGIGKTLCSTDGDFSLGGEPVEPHRDAHFCRAVAFRARTYYDKRCEKVSARQRGGS
jgi:hypothetical protein